MAGPWLGVLAGLAGPLVVATIYVRQMKKSDPAKLSQSISRLQRRMPKYVEARPFRSYHLAVIAAVIALPFVQGFAFLKFQTRLSFLLPLGLTAGLMFVVGTFYPRYVLTKEPNPINRRTLLRIAVVAGALLVLLALPRSGLVIVLRGAFTDVLALTIVGHLTRAFQSRRTGAAELSASGSFPP